MKDLKVEIKFKNNHLYKKIFKKHKSVNSFCRKYGLRPDVVGKYLNLKTSPISKNKHSSLTKVGDFYIKKSAFRLLEIFNCGLFELFPSQIWSVVSKTYSLEINSEDFISFNEEKHIEQQSLNSTNYQYLKKININNFKNLTDKERDIIKKRFGFEDEEEKTLIEIAKEYNVTPCRIRQIEKKALRKLRHPSNLKLLRYDTT